jgi:hypothetical protein
MYASGGQAGAVGEGQTLPVAVAYAHGPFGFGAGYFRATNNGDTANAIDVGSFDQFNSNSVDSTAISGAFAPARSMQIIRAAGDYKVDAVVIRRPPEPLLPPRTSHLGPATCCSMTPSTSPATR